MISLDDIKTAAGRIAPHVRRTPTITVEAVSEPVTDARLMLKLEGLQATGSFKARGATNKLLSMPGEAIARGIVTASGGNHGLAVARAARRRHVRGGPLAPAPRLLPLADGVDRALQLLDHGLRDRRVLEPAARLHDAREDHRDEQD